MQLSISFLNSIILLGCVSSGKDSQTIKGEAALKYCHSLYNSKSTHTTMKRYKPPTLGESEIVFG